MAYDPFSESTNRTKRNLLAVSFAGILFACRKIYAGGDALPVIGWVVKTDFIPAIFVFIILYLGFSLALHLTDDWLNSSEGSFFEDSRKAKQKVRAQLIERLRGSFEKDFQKHREVLRDTTDAANRVATVIVDRILEFPDIELDELEQEVNAAANEFYRGGKGSLVSDFKAWRSSELPRRIESARVFIHAARVPLEKRANIYDIFRRYRFWIEGLLPALLGAIALISLWWFRGAV